MKDFLPVLFYQAIVAVNTAVILNAIIWLAKRKEKQERKPNPDFAPPQTKKPPKPPTTGTSAIEQKPKGVSIVGTTEDCGNYGETIMLYGRKYRRASLWVSADKKVVSMEYVTMERVEDTEPKDGVSTDEAAKLFSKLSQAAAGLGGNSKLDELEETLKYLADTLDRTDKKPVTPERLKEAGFETEKVECRNCKHFLTTDEEYITGTCGQNDEITFANSVRACFEPKEKKAKPSCTDCRWFVKWRDGDTTCANTGLHISANLKGAHCAMFEPKPKDVLDALETAEKDWSKSKSCEKCRFSTENNEPNPNTVTCRFKQYHPVLRPRDGACWTCENYEPKPSTSKVKPVPPGTKTTH